MSQALSQNFFIAPSPIHGQGVFARRRFEIDSYLGRYEGPPTSDNDTYVLWVQQDNDEWLGIDGQNLLRFLNHSDTPNAAFYGDELYAIRPISGGDEITFDYGEEFRAAIATDSQE